MRLKPGIRDTVAQESINSRLLVDMGIIEPDFIPTLMSLYPEEAPFISILDTKGFKTKGINNQTNWLNDNGRVRTVASNHVQYRIANNDMRMEHFRSNSAGVTFEDFANPTKPGLNKQPFYVYLDSNWIGGSDVFTLGDRKTQLWVDNDRGGENAAGGVFRYKVKIMSDSLDDYVDPAIMADGYECQLSQTAHRQDFSEFGNERYTFGGYGDAYLSLQRIKFSYSGTAAAMDKNKKIDGRWVEFGGGKSNSAFLPYAHEQMLRFAARFADHQLLEGKGSVSQDTKKVILTDEMNREVLTGSGAMYSGDGPIEYPQSNGWTEKWLNTFMTNVSQYITMDDTGEMSAAVLLSDRSYTEFNILMTSMGVTRDSNIVGEGGKKIINNTYAGYNLAGITLYVVKSKRMSGGPGLPLNDGTMTGDYLGYMLPMGKTQSGDNGAQLIQLRPVVNGTVAGIDKGGAVGTHVSSSVDGTSEHMLWQNGVIYQNQPIIIYKPYLNNLI